VRIDEHAKLAVDVAERLPIAPCCEHDDWLARLVVTKDQGIYGMVVTKDQGINSFEKLTHYHWIESRERRNARLFYGDTTSSSLLKNL
jgi:hypothetical protein